MLLVTLITSLASVLVRVAERVGIPGVLLRPAGQGLIPLALLGAAAAAAERVIIALLCCRSPPTLQPRCSALRPGTTPTAKISAIFAVAASRLFEHW